MDFRFFAMKVILGFLKKLSANNNREWFMAHKDEYLEVKQKVENLTEKLIAAVASVDSEASRLTPSDCLYRIYRDTRFSTDKTPYKTHIGIFINPPYGKKSMTCGYYLHIEPGNCFFAAGTVCLPSPIVRAIRQSIYDEIDEYISIVESDEFREWFTTVGENPVKTAPRGFPKDWKYMNYIRPRDFVATAPMTETAMRSRTLPEDLLPVIRQAHRFNDFINYTITELA